MSTSVKTESEARSIVRASGIFFGIILVPILALAAFLRQGFTPLANKLAVCWTIIWVLTLAGNLIPSPPRAVSTPSDVVMVPELNSSAQVSRIADQNWSHYRNGRYVQCSITDGNQWYIAMPTDLEMRAGIGPRVNQAPSLSLWEQFCD